MQKILAPLLLIFCLVLVTGLVAASSTVPYHQLRTIIAYGYVTTVISLVAIADIVIYVIRRKGLLHRFSIRKISKY